jgi:hypothetical protein
MKLAYLRWCERRGYKRLQDGHHRLQLRDEAGIDGASFTVNGSNAYG